MKGEKREFTEVETKKTEKKWWKKMMKRRKNEEDAVKERFFKIVYFSCLEVCSGVYFVE